MASAGYLQLTRKVKLEPVGSAPANATTLTLEAGSPYKGYTAWISVAGGGVVNVSAQPRFANANDGAATAFAAVGTKKVFQAATDEIRPATRLAKPNPSDIGIPNILKSELVVTNSGVDPVEISVYMLATEL
jgi:hypothetical protein